ncbi:TonB family protein [Pelagibacterium sp. 26DY04]|uniref:energy transducer TonB family protein n=1 Tax=Pelagibacterium sp. 26DY04 TaxID=2967130 RepID=UPI00281590D5|nr:TonB family protein [Pelagibacterium sp. 26DY04]WMT87954.1 TonB family protein [Pelagibacterium sp. 26DY04]
MSIRAWTIAIVFSVLVHLALLFALTSRTGEIEIAGGAMGDAAVLGNAFETAMSAGGPEAVLTAETEEVVDELTPEPVTAPAPIEPVEALEPAETEMAEGLPAEAVEPDMVVVALESETAEPVAPEEVEVQAIEPEMVEALEPETLTAELSEPVEARETEVLEPETAVEAPPTPPQRPEGLVAPPRPQPQPQPPSSAGNGGTEQADTTQGAAQGSQTGTSTATGGGTASQAGNAAVSNYPGQVASALSRAFRYPPNGRGATGEAIVRFTVLANGQVAGATVVRSTGNAVLDQAALATVSRAAPFPPIPPAAGRSEWTFTLPLGFVR